MLIEQRMFASQNKNVKHVLINDLYILISGAFRQIYQLEAYG